jgi:cysteine desulfurase/selenocysteine lyase
VPRLTPAFVDTHSAPLNANGEPVLRNDAARLEPSELAPALRCGLANALQEALDIGLDNIRARIDSIAQTLRAELAQIDGVTVLDQGRERSGLVSFNVAGHEASAVQRALAAQGVTIGSNGVAYTPLDMDARGLATIARASVSYLTTEAEIGTLLDRVREFTR